MSYKSILKDTRVEVHQVRVKLISEGIVMAEDASYPFDFLVLSPGHVHSDTLYEHMDLADGTSAVQGSLLHLPFVGVVIVVSPPSSFFS